MGHSSKPIAACLAVILMASVSVMSQSSGPSGLPRDLTTVSLEDLLNVQVTSVSKKEQSLSKTAAAVYVITQEDIRRSGATNIPDLLRMAPGVDVARVNSNSWAISIRGFNDLYGNQVLVLIDGRSVFNPTFNGVNWDQQDVPLEDIERIEVIRGPGGTIWGANAVNGVINIITKSAKATPGGLLSAGAGSKMAGQGLVQYGGTIGDKGAYRAFAHSFDTPAARDSTGTNGADAWRMIHGGFRTDWDLSSKDSLTVQADVVQENAGETRINPAGVLTSSKGRTAEGNALGRWIHTLRDGSTTSLQVYYDQYDHNLLPLDVDEHRRTIDVDFNHHLTIGSRHDLVWGVGFRTTSDFIEPGQSVAFVPARDRVNLYSAFVQDQVRLARSLSLTLGSKFEWNSITGYEDSPSAQLTWEPKHGRVLWLSAGEAVREPARGGEGIQLTVASVPLPTGLTGIVTLHGTHAEKPEQLRDYETGYRTQVSKHVSLDVTGFLSYFRRATTQEPEAPYFAATPFPHLVIPVVLTALAHARNYGGEALANWTPSSRLKLTAGYTLLHMTVTRDPTSLDAAVERTPGASPKHEFQVRATFNPAPRWEWDSSVAYTGALTSFALPGYTRVDTRIGWHPGESVELSVVGQNLLSPRHNEFYSPELFTTPVERSVFAKVTFRF